jgi:O-antigen ligase
VLLWLADSFFSGEFIFSSSLLQIPLLGLLLIGFIQLLPLRGAGISGDLISLPAVNSLSLAPHSTLLFLVQLCVFLIFFVAVLTFLENQKRQRVMVFTIIIFGSAMAFFGIIQSLANPNPNSILGLRESVAFPFGTFINRHHFAAFMNMTIGLTLGLLYGNSTKRDKRLLLVISLILMGIALIFTGSRGAMLSLLAVIGFVILLNIFGKKAEESIDQTETKLFGFQKSFLLAGSGLVLVVVLVCAALFFGGESWVARGIGMNNQADASNGRIHFWQTAWQIFLNNPIFGAGLDAFGVAFTRYDTWNGMYYVNQAHNEYLHILAEAGILGFICLAAFIFLLFKKSLRIIGQSEDRFRRGTAVGALAGCLGILIHSLFDFPLRTSSNAFFFLTLAALATIATYSSKPLVRRRTKRAVTISEAELIQ